MSWFLTAANRFSRHNTATSTAPPEVSSPTLPRASSSSGAALGLHRTSSQPRMAVASQLSTSPSPSTLSSLSSVSASPASSSSASSVAATMAATPIAAPAVQSLDTVLPFEEVAGLAFDDLDDWLLAGATTSSSATSSSSSSSASSSSASSLSSVSRAAESLENHLKELAPLCEGSDQLDVEKLFSLHVTKLFRRSCSRRL